MSNSICPYCSKDIGENTDFCPHCGWFLKQPSPDDKGLEVKKEIEEARIFLALSSHEKWRIEKTVTTLGREMGDIMIRDDLELSRLHCEFIYRDHKLHIKDLDSHNGVFLGERRIPPQEEIPLQPGDKIKIGSNIFTIEFKSDTGTGEELGPIYYLKSLDGSREYQLRLGENKVGRGEFSHVRIDDAPYVAHNHSIIELTEDPRELGKIKMLLIDEGSKNGTTLNGVLIPPHKWREIDVGDEIGFADQVFTLVSRPRE